MINRWLRYGQMRRSVVVGILLSAALGLWSCKSAPPPPEAELPTVTLKPIEAPPEMDSIHCAIAADSPSLALMHVASEMGYFNDEGLEIQITKVSPSRSPKQLSLLNLLLQEDIDCVAQTLDGYLRTQDGQLFQTAVIASLYTSTGADGLVVTTPISSLADLLDQPIGGDRHHPGMLLTYHALRQLGYSPDDVVIKPIEWDSPLDPEADVEVGEDAQNSEDTADVDDTNAANDANDNTVDETSVKEDAEESGSHNSSDTENKEPNEEPLTETTTASTSESAIESAIESATALDSEPDSEPDFDSLTEELPVRPSYANVFREEGVVAIAASEPRLSHIVEDTGGQLLLTSVDVEDLLMGTLIVERSDLEKDSDRYRALLRGLYQAIALYESDQSTFLNTAAATSDRSALELDQMLKGMSYTSYSDLQRIIGAGASTGNLFQTFADLNAIHQDLELQNGPLFYDDHIDNRLIPNLFDPE